MAQSNVPSTSPVLRRYYARSTETLQHLDEILRRTSTFMKITYYFMTDLEHQSDSLRKTQPLLDLPLLNRIIRRNPHVDVSKGKGVLINPVPRCESSGTKSTIDEREYLGTEGFIYEPQASETTDFLEECYDEIGNPAWDLPPGTTLEHIRRVKSQLLQMVREALEKMLESLRRHHWVPEPDKTDMQIELVQLLNMNALQTAAVDFWANAEEKEGAVTELRRICVFGESSVDAYIFLSVEGDYRVVDSVLQLSEKLEYLLGERYKW